MPTLTLHTLAPAKGSRVKSFRIGRGNGSGRGTTAGRGTKGQRSRSGGKSGLRLKGMKQMLLSFPKNRGFNSFYAKARTIPLVKIESLTEGTLITMDTLRRANLVLRTERSAKIVGTKGLTKKFTVRGVLVTAGAKQAIEQAGGTVIA